MRRLGGGRPTLAANHGGLRFGHPPQRAEAGQLPARPLRPAGRGPGRKAHLHLQSIERRRRPDQQLGGPGRDEGKVVRPLPGLHARTHHVYHSLQHGPGRLEDRAHRGGNHRLSLRCGQHAHHDPHRTARARRARPGWLLREMPPLGGQPAGRRCGGRPLALQSGEHLHRPFPRGTPHHELRQRLRRQCPARQKVSRPAHRFGYRTR